MYLCYEPYNYKLFIPIRHLRKKNVSSIINNYNVCIFHVSLLMGFLVGICVKWTGTVSPKSYNIHFNFFACT